MSGKPDSCWVVLGDYGPRGGGWGPVSVPLAGQMLPLVTTRYPAVVGLLTLVPELRVRSPEIVGGIELVRFERVEVLHEWPVMPQA